MTTFTKEELDMVLKKFQPKYKHVEPHIILIIYGYLKMKEMEKLRR